MRARHRTPTLVSMWMLDVFCCALGCVTLLWLLKTREAGKVVADLDQAETRLVAQAHENEQLYAHIDEVGDQLALVRKERDATATQLALVRKERDENATRLALVRQERDENAKQLALTDEKVRLTAADLEAARLRLADLNKMIAALETKAAAGSEALARKSADYVTLNKKLSDASEQVAILERMLRDKEQARADSARLAKELADRLARADTRYQEAQRQVDAMARAVKDASKQDDMLARAQSRIKVLEKELNDRQAKLDQANVTIVDLQGTKAKLADKVDRLKTDTENRFAGISMSGKRVVFLVDMSGSMDRVDENTLALNKWPTVRETLLKVMRTLPDLEKFQVILFSTRVVYVMGDNSDWIPYEKETSIEQVRKAMSAIRPGGDTNMYVALEAAFKFREKGLDTIYLFSDGLPNQGPGLTLLQENANPPLRETERCELLARHIRRTLNNNWNRPTARLPRVRINSIGFFYESPDVGAFLWALSRENDGSFVGMSKP